MCNKLKITWLILINVLILTACFQKTEQPDLFVENTLPNESKQKSIYRISADGSHVEHIYDFGGRILYWFSPDFHYLAFQDYTASEGGSELVLTVMDMQTKQMVVQISDITPYLRQNSVFWDPTSSKLLFDKTTTDRGAVDWWVYNIAHNSQEVLAADASIKLFPAWSKDGQHVAYVSTPCPENRNNCNWFGDIWDITVVNIDTKIVRSVTDFANNSISLELETGDELFCNLKWSFNNQYIAFENQCIPGGFLYEKHRIFIVDITDMNVQEVLKFEQPYDSSYSYEWLETNDLLIGYTLFNSHNFLRGGVLSFDPLQTLDTRSAELFGFRGSEVNWSPDGSTFIGFTKELFFEIPQDGQLHASGATLLGDFSDGKLTIYPESNELPHGLCQGNAGYWSADRQYVAYSSTGEQHVCNQDMIDSDVFVYSIEDKHLNNLTQTLEGISKPIGWSVYE